MSFFNGSDVDETVLEKFETLADGDYLCTVKELTDETARNNPATKYFKVTFEVVRGANSGRFIWGNFTHQHHNPKAANIGRARMKQLCLAAVDKPAIDYPSEVYGKPVTVSIRTKPDKAGQLSTNVTGISGPNQAARAVVTPTNMMQTAPVAKSVNPLDDIPF